MLHIVTICGCGMGSSVILKMNAEKALKDLGIQAKLEVSDITTGKGAARTADLVLIGKELAYLPGQPPKGYTHINVIGDPGLLHCAVFRKDGGAGGFFALHDTEGVLFMAVAESNLAYGMGLAHMGRMVTYARYGADIFEELGEGDD